MTAEIHNLSLKRLMEQYQARLEARLNRWLAAPSIVPAQLHKAMRYSTLGGGKRIRPFLAYATGQALGAPLDVLDGPACAVELIHSYSLIHDDLPAMDNDDLRRGKPACHKAFDEATAILAGDALQALAFYILAKDPTMTTDTLSRMRMVEELGLAIGSRGMVGGQALDLAAEGRELNIAELEAMHIHKTGALIRASVKLGALSAPECPSDAFAQLDRYAKCVGLAFQIRDDILDEESDTATLGKPQGSDRSRQKSTYPALLGMASAKAMARELCDQAIASLAALGGGAEPLRWVASYMIARIR